MNQMPLINLHHERSVNVYNPSFPSFHDLWLVSPCYKVYNVVDIFLKNKFHLILHRKMLDILIVPNRTIWCSFNIQLNGSFEISHICKKKNALKTSHKTCLQNFNSTNSIDAINYSCLNVVINENHAWCRHNLTLVVNS